MAGTRTLGAFVLGAISTTASAAILGHHPPGGVERWTRSNHAGRPVTLLEGPAYTLGAVVGALVGGGGAPAAVAGLGAGSFGALDDLAGDSSRKGLQGHLSAARHGDVTTGLIKIVGLAATGLVTAWIVDRSGGAAVPPGAEEPSAARRLGVTLTGGAVIAGSANIANLLDLRPGRTLKVVLLLAVPMMASGRATQTSSAASATATIAGAAAGAALAAIPDDLASRSMLGDTGANSAGALLGTALVSHTDLPGRLLALAVLTALTLASEKVSFTAVIESTPGLRQLDALGRQPRSSPTGLRPGDPVT